VAGRLGIEHLIDHRLGEPLADIDFVARLGGLHPIEAQPCHHRAEVTAWFFDRVGIDSMPAQVSVLHHVFRFGTRAEHAVGKTDQGAPMRLEGLDCAMLGFCVHAAFVSSRSTGRDSPPTITRVHARP
jgi:hypothetical protein